MSLFFPIHRPRLGLSVTERGLALVELRRGWHKPGIVRVTEQALPQGVLTLSATEPNVKDREALVKALRTLVATSSERTLAVCLPDRICHLAVFAFDTVPPRTQELDAIVRWRFQQDTHVTLGDAWMQHRVFPVKGVPATAPTGTTAQGQVTAYVLAMAVKRSVLDQYEQVCREAGLLPLSFSCAALWLFDFYRPVMSQAANLFFVHQASDSMTFLAIRQGLPVFCRMKGQRREQADVMREIQSTVQFYEDLYPSEGTSADSRSVPLYMVGEGVPRREGGADPVTGCGASTSETGSSLMPQLILPDWKTLVSVQGATLSSEEGLYALACAGGR
jgi:hypothetical protein